MRSTSGATRPSAGTSGADDGGAPRRAGLRAAALAALGVSVSVFPGASTAAWAQDAAASANQPPPEVTVGAVEVRGNERLLDAVVAGESGIRAGDRVTYREIQEALRRLWASGQYADVQVFAREDEAAAASPDSPVTLVFQVEEQPYVGAIEFRGLENLSSGSVRDTAELEAGGPLRPARVAAAESAIRNQLSAKGIRVESLEHRLEPSPSRPGEHRLIFDVEEGNRVAVAAIEFEGNEAFSDDRLRDAMSMKSEGFFWFRDGVYREDLLEEDVRQNLPAFYGRHGYIDFTVTGDSLVVDPETGKARLIVQIEEGTRYRLTGFDIEGNRRFPTEALRDYFQTGSSGLLSGLGLGGGDDGGGEGTPYFDREAFAEATDQVRQAYRNQGYLRAQVEPVLHRTETEDGDPAVRAEWRIREGEPAYINRVAIEGNTRTHERVIREQIMLLPGDVYNEEALFQSYRRIAGLGFFETPMPTPTMEETPEGDVDVTFHVEEKQTGSLSFGTSIGGWQGVSGFLGYDEPNLFGQAKAGHLRWEYGRFVNNFEASYEDPAINGSRISGTASVFRTHPRLFRLPGGSYLRTGTSLRFGLPLPVDPYTQFTVGYSFSRTEYETSPGTDENQSVFNLPPGDLSTVSFGLRRSTLDHPLFPTQGTRQRLLADLSGGVFGGQGDFQKYTVEGNWWVPVGEVGGSAPDSRPMRFALGLSVDAGAIFGERASLDRFPFERFFMGGVQFGEPLRGYGETEITPEGYVPEGGSIANRLGDAYLRLSAEYAIRFTDNLSASLFYDAGNVWRSPSQVNPTELFRGAGFGLMLVTPFGPLGLDLGYGFDRDEPGWELHFKFGQAF